MFKVPEERRWNLGGPFIWSKADGNNGIFQFKLNGVFIRCIASDGMGWEHVSVSLSVMRTPDWDEMCFVKGQFWGPEDCVVQFHPPESEYVNNHEYCLHLWRPHGLEIKTPPSILVGIK